MQGVLLSKADDTDTQLIIECAQSCGIALHHASKTIEAVKILKSIEKVAIVITKLGTNEENFYQPLVEATREKDKKIFIVVFSHKASNTATIRTNCFKLNVNMVTKNVEHLHNTLEVVRESNTLTKDGALCPFCEAGPMSEDSLWLHVPVYHSNDKYLFSNILCNLCNKPSGAFANHLYNRHGPIGRGEMPSEDKQALKGTTYTFCLCVIRRTDGKFLVVHEVGSQGWWLPGGRLNSGEDLMKCAIRETKEESGIDVNLTGVLRVEYSPSLGSARLRVIFYGEPKDDNQDPKSEPDYESVGAAYVSVEELDQIPLRGKEPNVWFKYVHSGGLIHPIDVISGEGAPFFLK
eukprot:TRINITY_DN5575_c0_g1_i1.p1 TRINITY_DN5575_c0_g1~~TRINITY_DN5575_c0_g1_i1.p1  ORF type:complete len:408 (-),score=72.93 TRINITY_DN5575_c0_g1_i1:90-1136(-)